MSTLASQLRLAAKRLKAASFSTERTAAVADAVPIMEKAADALDAKNLAEHMRPKIDPRILRMLAALGRGTQFPGRVFYINRPNEFDAAARELLNDIDAEELGL